MGLEVKEIGICILPEAPWLAGSPDGLCWENGCPCGLLEVKTSHSWCDRFDGEILVDWLYQVNGCMRITSAALGAAVDWCDVFFWTPERCECRRIAFDQELWDKAMFPSLRNFYFNKYLPVAAEREHGRRQRMQ